MSNPTFRSLSASERALVAIAVLVDGADAGVYLEFDDASGAKFRAAALELSRLELDARLPFVGTVLRIALEELG